MTDIFDNLFFYIGTIFLVVLKVTGFIQWDWWVTALPAAFGATLHIISMIASR